MSISRDELLRNLIITRGGQHFTLIKLRNEHVRIFLELFDTGGIYFILFEAIDRRANMHCALYYLLDELLQERIFDENDEIKISSPDITDRQVPDELKYFTDMGFKLIPELGHPSNMTSRIGIIIDVLKTLCISGGKTKKYRKKRRSRRR